LVRWLIPWLKKVIEDMTEFERMTASVACARLCTAFSYHLDRENFAELANLFTEDGVFIRNGEKLSGRAAILEAYSKRPNVTTVHLVTNFHLIDLDRTSARASVHNLVFHAAGPRMPEGKIFDPLSAIRVIEFADSFAVVDGLWRFIHRHAQPLLQSPTWPGLL
jgi:hypothetical protein